MVMNERNKNPLPQGVYILPETNKQTNKKQHGK